MQDDRALEAPVRKRTGTFSGCLDMRAGARSSREGPAFSTVFQKVAGLQRDYSRPGRRSGVSPICFLWVIGQCRMISSIDQLLPSVWRTARSGEHNHGQGSLRQSQLYEILKRKLPFTN